jgi:hypothetical protein
LLQLILFHLADLGRLEVLEDLADLVDLLLDREDLEFLVDLLLLLVQVDLVGQEDLVFLFDYLEHGLTYHHQI